MPKHIATVALFVELSTVCALALFLIGSFAGQPEITFA